MRSPSLHCIDEEMYSCKSEFIPHFKRVPSSYINHEAFSIKNIANSSAIYIILSYLPNIHLLRM